MTTIDQLSNQVGALATSLTNQLGPLGNQVASGVESTLTTARRATRRARRRLAEQAAHLDRPRLPRRRAGRRAALIVPAAIAGVAAAAVAWRFWNARTGASTDAADDTARAGGRSEAITDLRSGLRPGAGADREPVAAEPAPIGRTA